MIFEKVTQLKNKDEFIEKILIFIRLVEVVAERKNISMPVISSSSTEMIEEMIDMGIIESVQDINLLSKIIGSNYFRFLSSLSFFLSHRNYFDSQLDKLNNKKRRILQEKELTKNKPKMVDFFAGAGGLSCGFTQAGYRVCFANDFEDVCVRTYRFNHPELPSKNVLKEDINSLRLPHG